MDIQNKLQYFMTLEEVSDGTIVKWFIYNARKDGLSDEQIVRELSIRNNMAVSSSSYAVLSNW